MSEARAIARRAVAELASREPGLLQIDGIDLGTALEQQLFFAVRDGRAAPSSSRARLAGIGRLAGASLVAVGNALRARRARGAPVVLVREVVHEEVVAAVNRHLVTFGSAPLAVVRVGRAAARGGERLVDQLDARLLAALWRHQLGSFRRLSSATRGWPVPLGGVAAVELPRIALGAAALACLTRRRSPSVLVAFDEVGTWARLLPAVAARHRTPSLDLPHAEAADPSAIAGAGYDRMAVYGPLAAARLEEAGIDPRRIVVIGAPRFDALMDAGPPATAGSARVVFAAQYVAGSMTAAGLEACHRAALAAAGALAPSELLVVPHPAEPPGTIAAIVARHPAPPGVRVMVDRPGGLHEALRGARLLVTGWSNSIFEAVLLGVPSIAVDTDGRAPMDLAAEGLATRVASPDEASRAATTLDQPEARAAALAHARAALPRHLGPLDGRAAERAARLILELAAGSAAGAAAA